MTEWQKTQAAVMRSNGYRVRHIADTLGVPFGDVSKALNPKPIRNDEIIGPPPTPREARHAVKQFLKRGYREEVIRANYGDLVSEEAWREIKADLAEGA